MNGRGSQPWLYSAAFDCGWILAPPFVASAVAYLLCSAGPARELSGTGWLVLVVGIDAAHVYATVFRTYLDPHEREARLARLTLTPLVAWVAGAAAYFASPPAFWRALAYLAVFHFVRQQYGWVRIYARAGGGEPLWSRRLDAATVYLAALYPLVYWHARLPAPIVWFVDGDFAPLPDAAEGITRFVYVTMLAAFIVKEVVAIGQHRWINIPKVAVIAGTALSWWIGIVALPNDLAFTITNVVSHGVPYVALVWLAKHRDEASPGTVSRVFFRRTSGLIPLWGALIFVAYVEEGFWDGFVWREHAALMAPFHGLPELSHALLPLVVPLLALPQTVHYLLDGFIWRVRSTDRPNWLPRSEAGRT